MKSYLRPANAATASLTAAEVATAYNFPPYTGKGATVGLIELGGGFDPASFAGLVTAVPVVGGKNAPDGPDGADGEVQLDIEIVRQTAPDAAVRVYFAPNTDTGFIAAVKQAVSECQVVSISWGQAETQWSTASIKTFSAVFAAARAAGVPVFAAAGDSGSDDSTSAPVTDYPASDPNVIGCGGTRLILNSDGTRAAEVTWDDNDTSSATGGGVSKVFPGRQVPDIAGNADPDSGYLVTIDGNHAVIGGTSAVAPLYAGLAARLVEAGARADWLKVIPANPTVCYDVTVGDNGAYRAGPGRDQVTGFGVVDGGKLLAVLTGGNQLPAPVPTPVPTPTPAPAGATWTGDPAPLDALAANPRGLGLHKRIDAAVTAWQAGSRA